MYDIICLAFLFIIMCFGFNHVVAQISSSFFLLPLPPLCRLLPFLTLLLLLMLRSIELCAYSYMTIFLSNVLLVGNLDCFQFFFIVDTKLINIPLQVLLWFYVFIFLGKDYLGQCMCNFTRNWQRIFQSGWTV